MEMNNADTTPMADVLPTRKKRGRKPTVFLNNKPIDPKYYVNYYHNVTKQKDHPCPYCNKKFARSINVQRHLKDSNKDCALKHFRANHPELESDSDSDSDGAEWYRYYHSNAKIDIPDSSPINEWLNHLRSRPPPQSQAEWVDAGQLMLKMLIDNHNSKHGIH